MSYETPNDEAEKGHKIQIARRLEREAERIYAIQTEMSDDESPFAAIHTRLIDYRADNPQATAEEIFEALATQIVASAALQHIEMN